MIWTIILGIASTALAADQFSIIWSSAPFAESCEVNFKECVFPSRTPNPYGHAISLHEGKYSSDSLETELQDVRQVKLGTQRATLVTLLTSNTRGSGSWTNIFVVICNKHKSSVVFEAVSEGLKVSYKAPAFLELTYPVWLPGDSHAKPGRVSTEIAYWNDLAKRFEGIRR